MKSIYHLLFIGSTSLAIAANEVVSNERDPFEIVQQENREDAFGEREQIFENDNVSAFASEKENIHVTSSNEATKGKLIQAIGQPKVVGTDQGSMLSVSKDGVKVNSDVLDGAHHQDILWLTQYLYFATKRWTEDRYIYENAFDATPSEKPLGWEELKKSNIKIAAPIHGTDGKKAEAIIGMLAYRDLRAEKGLLELFAVFKGSQGETFEAFSGYGGPSWLTNFQGLKHICDAQELGLDKYKGKLSFHDGYYSKIYTSKRNWENELRKLFNALKVKGISEFIPQKSGDVSQQDIDNWRGCKVKCYIFGHSQGGGLTQIGAPYITTFLGRWLYGKTFDNKTFNTCHAVCMSPARAIGDKETMDVVLDVMGEGNIFGYCSPIDLVTCLPFGKNYRGIIKRVLDKISPLLPEDYQNAISSVDKIGIASYETLPIFAYVDYGALFEKYCEIGSKVYSEYITMQLSPYHKHFHPEFEVRIKEIQEKGKALAQIKEKLPEIKEHIEKMQEHYFKAHSFWTAAYHIARTVHHAIALIRIVGLSTLVGIQHWGAPVILHHPDLAENVIGINVYKGYRMDVLFSRDMIEAQSIQECLDRGTAYDKHKKEVIGE